MRSIKRWNVQSASCHLLSFFQVSTSTAYQPFPTSQGALLKPLRSAFPYLCWLSPVYSTARSVSTADYHRSGLLALQAGKTNFPHRKNSYYPSWNIFIMMGIYESIHDWLSCEILLDKVIHSHNIKFKRSKREFNEKLPRSIYWKKWLITAFVWQCLPSMTC